MTVQELLADLDDRIDRGIETLKTQRARFDNDTAHAEYIRLSGKIDGLQVAKDWLRSY